MSTYQPMTVDSFFEEARKGRILGLKCEFGHVTVPPRHSCRVCGSQKLEIITLSGRGEVISFTDVYVKAIEFPVEAPYTLALVRLEEGGNLLGVVRGKTKPTHGSKVTIRFEGLPNSVVKWPRTFFDLE